jgi:ribokinase
VRAGVVGHVDWIEFLVVDRVPEPGEIVQAKETWGEAAGGGGVAAVQLARRTRDCLFFTALGSDELGRRAAEQLADLGVRLEIDWRDEPQRRGFTYLDSDGERTITLLSEKLRPRGAAELAWSELGELDAVYFTGGDAEALRAARAAPVLVATPRELPTLREGGVELDALAGSASDPAERYEDGDLDPPPKLVVWTEGEDGGSYEPGGGRWEAEPLPGPFADSYGAGDSFAAALTVALAEGRPPAEAVRLAALGAAEAMTRRGAHGIR